MFIEVQSKAKKSKAFIRTGCQQDQELLDDSLNEKEKTMRQLRWHQWCFAQACQVVSEPGKEAEGSHEMASTRICTQILAIKLCGIHSFYKKPVTSFYLQTSATHTSCFQTDHPTCPAGTLQSGFWAGEEHLCAPALRAALPFLGDHSGPNLPKQTTLLLWCCRYNAGQPSIKPLLV